MKIKQSPLELVDLAIINFDYGLNPDEITVEIQELFAQYDVDMDFAVKTDIEDIIRILVKVKVNRPADGQLPGYSLFAESVGLFKFSDELKSSEDKLRNIVNSGLAMSISYLRTFVAGVTGHFPLGKYWIPSVDLNAMIKMKAELTKAKGKATKPGKKPLKKKKE